jgi:multidrug efflux pump subunit AcrA (membrane-fusion protein)
VAKLDSAVVAPATISLEGNRRVVQHFEGGIVDEILVDEGDVVKAGQPLATLDTSLLEAERTRLTANQSALEAQLRFARQTVERLSKLNDQGFASQAGLDEALARSDELVSRIAEVEAALTSNAIQTEKSKVLTGG